MYSEAFDRAVNQTLMSEGLYSDHPEDAGGPTMYGITQALARAHGYDGSMRDLLRDRAIEIYHAEFWLWDRLDEVAEIDGPVAREIFDTSVNMGNQRGVIFLQRLLRVFNRRQRDYPDIVSDGRIGPKTIEALRLFVEHRGQIGRDVLLRIPKRLANRLVREACPAAREERGIRFRLDRSTRRQPGDLSQFCPIGADL